MAKLTHEQLKSQQSYLVSMQLTDTLGNEEVLNEADYECIKTKLRDEYSPILPDLPHFHRSSGHSHVMPAKSLDSPLEESEDV